RRRERRNIRCPGPGGCRTRKEDRAFRLLPSVVAKQLAGVVSDPTYGAWIFQPVLRGTTRRKCRPRSSSRLHRTEQTVGAFSRLVSRRKESHCLGRRSFAKSRLLDSATCWGIRYQDGDCSCGPTEARRGFRGR